MTEFSIGEYYKYIYIAFCFLILFSKTFAGMRHAYIVPENSKTSFNKALLLGVIFILFFGLRPTSGTGMADTGGYAGSYQRIRDGFINENITSERVWHYIQQSSAGHDWDVSVWFTIIAAIYILFNIYGIRRIFPSHTYAVFLLYTVFFLFYSGGINGIRNACGYSVVFYAMSLYTNPCKRNYILMALWCLVGYQFHSSVMVTALSFLTSLFVVKNTKTALIIWLVAISISLLFGSSLAFYASSLIDDGRADKYMQYGLNNEQMEAFSHAGFRWDFLIFSALPIAVGYYITIIRDFKDKLYLLLLNTYIIANAVWVVFIYAAFSNRFAMLSWCIYPYVLIYPYVKFNLWPMKTQNQRALTMVWMMFVFTIFMLTKY